MPQGSFTAQVNAQVANTKALLVAVYRESAERTVEVMQAPRGAGGNLRVDTGFLRASLMAGIGNPTFAIRDKPEGEGSHPYNAGQVSLVIAGAQITDPIVCVYTASYARPREYGSRGQPGDRWVALAAQQWPQIVEQVSREAQSRVS